MCRTERRPPPLAALARVPGVSLPAAPQWSRALASRRHRRRLPGIAMVLALGLASTGCMVLPRTTTSYAPDCRMHVREVTLEAVPISGIVLNCSSTPASCTAGLVMAGVVTGASVVVSGSIAVVGNVVYWIEKRGQCATAAAAGAG